jgi:hypothetical protein
MQALGRRYVQYFNFKYQRSGTLWEGRFKSCLVQVEDYLLEVCRYIELNPVRASPGKLERKFWALFSTPLRGALYPARMGKSTFTKSFYAIKKQENDF